MLNAKQMGYQDTYSVVLKKKRNRIEDNEWDLILPNDSLKYKGYSPSENVLSY